MEPTNSQIVDRTLKERFDFLLSLPLVTYDRSWGYDPLLKPISVDNPLEPEKGGFLQAYKKNFAAKGSQANRKVYKNLEWLSYDFFDIGVSDRVRKIDIETGLGFYLGRADVNADQDFRLISLRTVKNLGLELKDPENLLRSISKTLTDGGINTTMDFNNLEAKRMTPYKSSYFQASIEFGFLVSLDNIADRDFVNALDRAAEACRAVKDPAKKYSFDDAKYEPQFNKLEHYFKHFGIDTKPDWDRYHDYDVMQEDFKISNGGSAFKSAQNIPWENINKFPFKDLDSLPPPSYCNSENAFLRIGAHIITNSILDNAINDYKNKEAIPFKFTLQDNALMKDATKAAMVKDIAGTMFAAQFGVPFTQNDVNRFNSRFYSFKSRNFDDKNNEFYRVFNLATKVAVYARDLDVSKELSTSKPTPENPSLWSNWKAGNEQYAMQMATPSLNELCEQKNVEINKDSIIKALNDFTSQKFNEVAQNKEPIKAALSQEQPINQALITNSISVPADKSKEPQTKGAER